MNKKLKEDIISSFKEQSIEDVAEAMFDFDDYLNIVERQELNSDFI